MDFEQRYESLQALWNDIHRKLFKLQTVMGGNAEAPPMSPIEQLMVHLRSPELRGLPNAFQLAEANFRSIFGFEKPLAAEVLMELRARTYYNPNNEDKRRQVPFDLRVLATLSFLVHGHVGLLLNLDAFKAFSKSVLMRCVVPVTQEIVNFMTPQFVTFPSEIDDVVDIKNGFLDQFGVPGVVGVVDCFHVKLSKVRPEHDQIYRNRSGHTSINVQVICDGKMRFLDVNPRYPGSRTDNYIWKRSHVHHIMKHTHEQDRKSWLVADRGYHLEGCVVIPFRNAATPRQQALNTSLNRVHGVLDNAVAILKGRFSCLGTILPFRHQDCANIVTACITLHNFIMFKGHSLTYNVAFKVPRKRDLPNAHSEDDSQDGRWNREFIQKFLLFHAIPNLIKHQQQQQASVGHLTTG